MRYQGRITDWKDDRGFGFITPNGGGAKVFVHISALAKGQARPAGDELVTYALETDGKRGTRADNVAYVRTRGTPARAERRGTLMPVIAALLVLGVGAYGWRQFTSSPTQPPAGTESVAPIEKVPQIHMPQFQCQGKQVCSEMTSCEEATFYLKNCPGVKIDGDGDGIPCESQWCGG